MSRSARVQRAHHVSARVRRRVQALATRARHRLGLPLPNPGAANISPRFRHPIDAARKSELTRRYQELFPDAARSELEEAARLSSHNFSLLGYSAQHSDRIAWARDPVSGQDWSRGFSPDIPYRGPARLGDIKLPWELNKHQYFFTLGKAGWLTGAATERHEIIRQIEHWIDDNPFLMGINWISALETGTRAVSWITAYPFYAEGSDQPFRRRLCESLAQHMLFVEQHLSTGPFPNTHLAGEAAALVVGGLFLDSRHSARWLAKGVQILEDQLAVQVTAEGMHAERSVPYHRFFLDQYYLVAGFLAANGHALSTSVLERMEAMTSFLMHVLFADGTAPAFGDGDDARGLWFRADCPKNYSSLLALGAVLFNRGDFKAAANGLTEEVLWLLGPEGVRKFEQLPPALPDRTSVSYPESGYHVMRGGWGSLDPVLVFDTGVLGFGSAAHGHSDALSFQLHAAGYPFLVDAGTFSYNLDYEWRNAFRGTRAHNTVLVDGQDQSVPGDRMSWKSVARTQTNAWVTTPWFDLADGQHDGYERLSDPVTHQRVVIFLKPDAWIIWDVLTAQERHQLELLLHVHPACRIVPGTNGGVILDADCDRRLSLWISESGVGAGRLEAVAGDERERGAWFSPSYGVRMPSRVITFTRQFERESSIATCLSSAEGNRPQVTHAPDSIELRLRREADSEASLFYRRLGGGAPKDTGVRFDGTLLFQRRSGDGSRVAWASGFQKLAIEGLLDIEAPTSIERLVLQDDCCAIAMAAEQAKSLRFHAHERIRLVVNGS